ncbi:MAG: hypothetical protein H0X62_14980 [Bacteroidetes bacterium]|nr:hypothetical protein [Bacteroidota bacterium]
MNKYTITSHKTKLKLIAIYSRGKLFSLEIKQGTLDKKLWVFIPLVVPHLENDIDNFRQKFNDRVLYEASSGKPAKTIYGAFTEAWFNFYNKLTGLDPKFNGTDGKAMKQIASYILKQSVNEDQALISWEVILNNWPKLDKFTQSKPELPYINSHLNSILKQLKDGKSNSSEDIRQSL